MVTDGILGAVNQMIRKFKTDEQIRTGNMIYDMLADFDEDEWYDMNDEQIDAWISKYVSEY